MAREGVPINVIQRQLGQANLGVTSTYLQGIDYRAADLRSQSKLMLTTTATGTPSNMSVTKPLTSFVSPPTAYPTSRPTINPRA